MSHVKGSPPKSCMRSTARARLTKCPAMYAVNPDVFGVNMDTGKSVLRRKFFDGIQRGVGVRGERLKPSPLTV